MRTQISARANDPARSFRSILVVFSDGTEHIQNSGRGVAGPTTVLYTAGNDVRIPWFEPACFPVDGQLEVARDNGTGLFLGVTVEGQDSISSQIDNGQQHLAAPKGTDPHAGDNFFRFPVF